MFLHDVVYLLWVLTSSSFYLSVCRVEFERTLENFAAVSTAPTWTFVFCSLTSTAMIECGGVAMKLGYKVEVYVWNKPDLSGKSHRGGPRQARSSEYIVVVYKHEDTTTSTLAKHFALLSQKDTLVRLVVCITEVFSALCSSAFIRNRST